MFGFEIFLEPHISSIRKGKNVTGKYHLPLKITVVQLLTQIATKIIHHEPRLCFDNFSLMVHCSYGYLI